MRTAVVLPLLLACKGPEPAPTELEELIGWMFVHLAEDDESMIVEGSTNLDLWMDSNLEDTLDGYEVEVLEAEDIESLGVGTRDLTGLQGVSVGYQHLITVPQVADALMEDPTVLHPNLYVTYEYEELAGSKECFAEGSCDWVEYQSHATENLGLGITLDISNHIQMRRFDTPGGEALAYRYWTTESPTITTTLFSLDQVYFFWAFVPHDGEIRSMQASWVVAQVLAADLDSNLIMNLWVDGMVNGAEDLDQIVLEE